MSTAFYPLGMNSYNNRLKQGGYKSWKGTGTSQNPIGTTSGNIKPFTNNDIANSFVGTFGRARPIKHVRKGRAFNEVINISDPNNSSKIIQQNISRQINSANSSSVMQLMDIPGGYTVNSKQNNALPELVLNGGFTQYTGTFNQPVNGPPYTWITYNISGNTYVSNWQLNVRNGFSFGIANQNSTWGPTITNLPGNLNLLYAKIDNANDIMDISQNINIAPGKYTLSFYYGGRKGNMQGNLYYDSSYVLNVYIGEIKIINELVASNNSWRLSTTTFDITTNGIFSLKFEFLYKLGLPISIDKTYVITGISLKLIPPCSGIPVITDYLPNPNYFSENAPCQYITNKLCNPEKKARRRSMPASSVIKETYYNTLQQYRENRCQTYNQKVFDFIEPSEMLNTYIVNCQPNTLNPENNSNLSSCKLAIYKPSNAQFAKQGAVANGTRLFRLKVNTIKNDLAVSNKNIIDLPLKSRDLVTGSDISIPFLFNNKEEQTCVNERLYKFQNKTNCKFVNCQYEYLYQELILNGDFDEYRYPGDFTQPTWWQYSSYGSFDILNWTTVNVNNGFAFGISKNNGPWPPTTTIPGITPENPSGFPFMLYVKIGNENSYMRIYQNLNIIPGKYTLQFYYGGRRGSLSNKPYYDPSYVLNVTIGNQVIINELIASNVKWQFISSTFEIVNGGLLNLTFDFFYKNTGTSNLIDKAYVITGVTLKHETIEVSCK